MGKQSMPFIAIRQINSLQPQAGSLQGNSSPHWADLVASPLARHAAGPRLQFRRHRQDWHFCPPLRASQEHCSLTC